MNNSQTKNINLFTENKKDNKNLSICDISKRKIDELKKEIEKGGRKISLHENSINSTSTNLDRSKYTKEYFSNLNSNSNSINKLTPKTSKLDKMNGINLHAIKDFYLNTIAQSNSPIKARNKNGIQNLVSLNVNNHISSSNNNLHNLHNRTKSINLPLQSLQQSTKYNSPNKSKLEGLIKQHRFDKSLSNFKSTIRNNSVESKIFNPSASICVTPIKVKKVMNSSLNELKLAQFKNLLNELINSSEDAIRSQVYQEIKPVYKNIKYFDKYEHKIHEIKQKIKKISKNSKICEGYIKIKTEDFDDLVSIVKSGQDDEPEAKNQEICFVKKEITYSSQNLKKKDKNNKISFINNDSPISSMKKSSASFYNSSLNIEINNNHSCNNHNSDLHQLSTKANKYSITSNSVISLKRKVNSPLSLSTKNKLTKNNLVKDNFVKLKYSDWEVKGIRSKTDNNIERDVIRNINKEETEDNKGKI